MAIPNDVRPGDLITAQFVNTLLGELRALSGRVATLEARPEGEEAPPPGTIEIDFDAASLTPAAGRALDLRYVVTNGTVSRATLDVRAAIVGAVAAGTGGIFTPRALLLDNVITRGETTRLDLDVFASANDRAPTGSFSVAAGDQVELFARVPAKLVESIVRANVKPRVDVVVSQGGKEVTRDSQKLSFDRRDL
jgi:hypothetical protein